MIKRLSAIMLAALFLAFASACGRVADEQITDSLYGGLFDTSKVHSIKVELSDEDWKDLKANPLEKTKYKAVVTIDGTKVEDVSFSTKGNTSLSQVADSDSDRYSFKINFGKFVKGKTYNGLKKLALNNVMSDATYMKDYLSYTIMRKAGVNASLVSYTTLSINGSLHGLYIAIEDVSDSFLTRNYGDDSGALYKPETSQLSNVGKDGKDRKDDERTEMTGEPPTGEPPAGMPATGEPPTGERPTGEGPQPGFPGEGDPPGNGQFPGRPDGAGPAPGFGGASKGADLVYSDDEVSSYTDIFDNAENDVSLINEHKLIKALKALNTGEEIEKYWDTDQVIRYFAAHNFVLNYDSYTGNMLHNYYLYERSGNVTVFPTDYNLAFGGFEAGTDATELLNGAIDTPLRGAEEASRPLWNMIASNEEYLAKYHSVYDELLKDYFESGECEKEIKRIRKMISPYVKSDPTAFYSFEEFEKAIDTLKTAVKLRSQSIRKQLDGSLASVTSEQKKEDMVDASAVNISAMGTQGGGGPNGGHGDLPAGPPNGGMQPGPGGQALQGTPPAPPNGGNQ